MTSINASPSWSFDALTPPPDIFFTLPLEIRDMIYELVYGGERTVKVVMRKEWQESERRQKMYLQEDFLVLILFDYSRMILISFQPTPFAESPLGHLLVNKQYFEEACRVWIRNTTFCFDSEWTMEKFVNCQDPIHRLTLHSVAKIISNDSIALEHIWKKKARDLQSLRSLSTPFSKSLLCSDIPNKRPWLCDYTDVELASIGHLRSMLAFRGLRNLELRWPPFEEARKPSDQHRLAQFKIQVQRLIDDVVTQPREESSTNLRTETLDEAFQQRKDFTAAQLQQQLLEESKIVNALPEREVPRSEEQMLRLCLTRPKALFKWIRDAADERNASFKS